MLRRIFAAQLAAAFALTTGCAQTPSPSPAPASSPVAPAAATARLGYNSVHVDGPYIAMTFDDGPHGKNTPRLLDMLKARGIKATFFMVGQCAEEFPAIVKRIAAEGHEVANHSWAHPDLSKMSEEAVRSQIARTQTAIENACGIAPTLLRPPYGAITDKQRRWITADLHLKIILWSLDPLDWKDRNAATVARRILAEAHPGSIVLSHDIHATTVDAMPQVFDTLLERGMKFVTVSELLALETPLPPKPSPSPKASPSPKTSPAPQASPAASSPAPKTSPAPKKRSS